MRVKVDAWYRLESLEEAPDFFFALHAQRERVKQLTGVTIHEPPTLIKGSTYDNDNSIDAYDGTPCRCICTIPDPLATGRHREDCKFALNRKEVSIW